MELLLLILKIILIALLVVLGLIILLLGIILFVPIRYEVSGSIGDSWELKVKGKLTYLLSIFKLIFSYENGQTDMQIYLFGVPKKSVDEALTEETVDGIEPSEESEIAEEKEEAVITIHEKVEKTSVDVSADSKAPTASENDDSERKEKPKTVSSEMRSKKDKKKSKFDFSFWKQQLTDEHNKSVVKKIWSELGYLLKHFKFRRIETDFVFAIGDPATTGQVFGVLCMIPVLYRYEIKIVPDFDADDAYLKGKFLVAGKVRVIHLLMTLLRLIFDKEVRLVVKRVLTLLDK